MKKILSLASFQESFVKLPTSLLGKAPGYPRKRGMNNQKDEFGVLAGDGSLQEKKVRHPELLVYTWLERSERKDGLPLFCHFILLHPPVFTFSLLPFFLLLWIICILLSSSHLFSPAVSFAPSDLECSVSSSKPNRSEEHNV